MVVASVLILVLCIIKVKKLKVDARKSGMPRLLLKKKTLPVLCNNHHLVRWCDVHSLVT